MGKQMTMAAAPSGDQVTIDNHIFVDVDRTHVDGIAEMPEAEARAFAFLLLAKP